MSFNSKFPIRNQESGIRNPMDRLRSQLLGIIVLALIFLLLACVRYYFQLG